MSDEKIKSWIESKKGQKVVLAGFFALVFVIIIIVFVSLTSSIKSPFGEREGWSNYIAQQNNAEIEKLKETDTDNDGLSDFEEKIIYGTSIYIADTDSDGIKDGDEIKQNEDPLCAKGSNCGYVDMESLYQAQEEQTAQMSVDQVRLALVQSGLSADLVNSVDDETLMEIYSQSVGSSAVDLETNEAGDSEYSAGAIRVFMTSIGMDAEILEQISDEELIETYEKTVVSTGQDPIQMLSDGEGFEYVEEFFGVESDDVVLTEDDYTDLREYLVSSGISQEEVDAVSDEELQEIIQSIQ